jgi:putative acetyltransferase
MRIEVDDLSRPAIHELLSEHLANMYELSPPEQVFEMDLSKLKSPDIRFGRFKTTTCCLAVAR